MSPRQQPFFLSAWLFANGSRHWLWGLVLFVIVIIMTDYSFECPQEHVLCIMFTVLFLLLNCYMFCSHWAYHWLQAILVTVVSYPKWKLSTVDVSWRNLMKTWRHHSFKFFRHEWIYSTCLLIGTIFFIMELGDGIAEFHVCQNLQDLEKKEIVFINPGKSLKCLIFHS